MQETQETWVQSLSQEDLLEEGMGTCSSILAWIIPWTEEPHGLQSMGSQRVKHDWAVEHKGTQTCWNAISVALSPFPLLCLSVCLSLSLSLSHTHTPCKYTSYLPIIQLLGGIRTLVCILWKNSTPHACGRPGLCLVIALQPLLHILWKQ